MIRTLLFLSALWLSLGIEAHGAEIVALKTWDIPIYEEALSSSFAVLAPVF